ncbi:MAG TPA: hypothetical protein VFT22_13490, partial [Kofleriaceae bacterium]|nr:hypothetical protein [Kofleriaceae bacterium]
MVVAGSASSAQALVRLLRVRRAATGAAASIRGFTAHGKFARAARSAVLGEPVTGSISIGEAAA